MKTENARLLVIGAGVNGSAYATRLYNATLDVRILAHGRRCEEIRDEGIIIENQFSGKRSMAARLYSPNLTGAEVLQRTSPEMCAVFLAHKAACVGCSLAGFCTLKEAAETYRTPLGELLGELERAADPPIQPNRSRNG